MPEKKSDDAVLIDTSVWIEYFRGKNRSLILQVNDLIAQRRIRNLSIITAELIRGCLHSRELDAVKDRMDLIPHYAMEDACWQKVGLFSYQLARRGVSVGMVDASIAYFSIREKAYLLSLDKDFRKIAEHSNLSLFKA